MSPSPGCELHHVLAALTGALLLAWGIGTGTAAPAPDPSGPAKPADLARSTAASGLAQLDYLTEEWAPFNYTQQGAAAGISVDILEAVFRDIGVDRTRVGIRIVPLAEGFQAAQKGPGKVLFAIVRTPERESLYKWAGPFTRASFVLYAPMRSNIRITSAADLNRYSIGTVAASIENDLLATLGVRASRIVNRQTPAELLRMLEAGEIDLWATGDLAGRHQMLQTARNPNAFESVYTLSENDFYFVFSKDVPDALVGAFQQALGAVRDRKDEQGVSEYERIIYRNLGVGCARQTFPDDRVVALVDATAAAIAANAPDALQRINRHEAPYRDPQDPGLYVFVYDIDTTMVAHADNARLVGVNFRGKVDVAGTPLHDRIHAGALQNGTGWVDYVYLHPTQPNLYHKTAYYRLARGSDGKSYVVASGNYRRCDLPMTNIQPVSRERSNTAVLSLPEYR
jgi:polar amino acid transport system substrate-binding protein